MVSRATMTPAHNQQMALAVLIALGAIVAGYLVFCAVPVKHFPRMAGMLSAIGIVAGLTVLGVEVAGDILGWFVLAVVTGGIFLASADFEGHGR